MHSRLGMAHSLIDSIDAEHLDVERAFRHFDAAGAVLERGRARGHLETGLSSAFSYALRIAPGIEAGRRGMEIGEELGDELLWAGAAQAYGWHAVAGGRLAEGFAVLERSFEVADRHQRSFLAIMGSKTRGQLTWGLGAPEEARPWLERPLELPYFGRTGYEGELADAVGRCNLSTGRVEEARSLLAEARPGWITHSLAPLLALWDGEWDRAASTAADVLATSRRTGNRWDEWGAHHLAARVHYLRGEFEPAISRLEQGLAIVTDGGATYFEMWARPDLARALAESGRIAEAREHADRCREVIDGGEDWRGRAGVVAVAEGVVLSGEGRHDEAVARFASALDTLRSFRLVAEQADCLHAWAVALRRAGDGSSATEKLREATELYAGHGA